MHPSEAAVSDPRTQRLLTRNLAFIVFFSVLNGTMFNVSVPDIALEFGLMPSEVSWVMTAYIIMFALGTVTYGKLADIFPARNLVTTGLILMSAGSVVGLTARWYPVLIAARFVQAAGGSSIPALAMLIATQYFPRDIKGRVLGVIASTVAFSAGVGPIVGGFITGHFHWRFLFLFSLVTLLTIPAFRRLLPEEAKERGRGFDLKGAALLGVGAAALLLAVTESVWWLLPFSAALFAVFARHIKKAETPFIGPAIFRNRCYRNSVAAAAMAMGSFFGATFMTPLMLREVNALRADSIGLVLFPGAMSAALLGRAGGRLVDRIGGVKVAYSAMGMMLAGYFLLSTFAGVGPLAIAMSIVLCYVGFAFVQSSMAHTVSGTLSRGEAGIGMGIYNMCFFMSGAFTASALGRLLDIKRAGFCLNPFATCRGAWLFSNLYLLLAALALLAAAVLYAAFRCVVEGAKEG